MLFRYNRIDIPRYAIIFVSGVLAVYSIAIFSMWLIDARQDYEKTPIAEKVDKLKKRRTFQLLAPVSEGGDSPPPTPPRKIAASTAKLVMEKFTKRLKYNHRWFSIYYREKKNNYNRIRRTTVVSISRLN